jgi:hypothetical protein
MQAAIPPLTPNDKLVGEMYDDLAAALEGTSNMYGMSVGLNIDSSQIDVPAGDNNYITCSDTGAGFHAVITHSGKNIVMKVIGRCGTSSSAPAATPVRVALRLQFAPQDIKNTFFNFGLASRGAVVIDTKNTVTANPTSHASILSEYAAASPVTIGSSSGATPGGIAGDITVLQGYTPNVYANWSVGGTTIQSTIMSQHVTSVAPALAPEFPVADTAAYRQYAVNTYLPGLTTYENIIVPPLMNPIFASGTTIRGVVYIQQPNIVTFNGNVTIQGVIVTEDKHTGDLTTNQLVFSGNGGSKTGVETLPAGAQFDGLRNLIGSFIVAPGFDVQLTGNFGNIGGSIAGDRVTLNGSSASTVTGTVMTLKSNPLKVTGNTAINLAPATTSHAGLAFSQRYSILPSSYAEVAP